MRIAEIADPQSALGLWKLISDNTWAALEQQAQQQAQEQQQKSAAKAKHAKSGGGKRTPARIPRRPRPPATPRPKAQSAQSTAQGEAKRREQQSISHHTRRHPSRGVPVGGGFGRLWHVLVAAVQCLPHQQTTTHQQTHSHSPWQKVRADATVAGL